MAQKKVKKATAGVEAPVVDVVDASNKKVGERMLAAAVFKVRVNDHLIYEAVKHYRGRRSARDPQDQDARRGFGHRPQAVASEGHRACPRRGGAHAAVAAWRHRVRSAASRLLLLDAEEGAARRAALRADPAHPGGSDSRRGELPRDPGSRAAAVQADEAAHQLSRWHGLDGKAVLVDEQPDEGLTLSSRNIPGVRVLDESALTVYEVLDCTALVFSQQALAKLEERLSR